MTAFIDTLEAPTAGKNGHIAASTAGWLGETIVRITDAAVNCGLFVCNGATPGTTCKVPTTAAEAQASLGCLIDPEYLNETGAATDYLIAQQATILQKGYIWVNTEGTVAVDDPVFVRFTSDGASNTVLGKARKDSDVVSGGVVITPDASFAAVASSFTVVLSDGTLQPESFTFTSDASPTTAEVAAGLVALIDASTRFAATGTVTVSVTSTTGVVEVVSIDERLMFTTPARAARLKGARFASAVSGAGLAKVRLQLRQDF
jgi:hypothetical protein